MPPAANQSNASRYRLRRRAARLALAARAMFACAVAGPVLLSAAAAQAAPVAGADANAAPTQAWTKAYAQKQWSVAIELLETIPESSRTAWHWLHLARALERSEQLVEAFGAYERVRDLAADGSDVVGMREVERQAKLESSALAHRIPWAEVSLTHTLPVGALVFVDQQWLEPTRLRSPYPVNPGWHTFLVESNGEVLAARRAFFEEGQTRLVPLTVLNFEASLPEAGVNAAPAEAAPTAGDARATRRTLTWHPSGVRRTDAGYDSEHDSNGLLRASYVTLGVGALGTLVGTGFLVSVLNMRTGIDDYAANCFDSRCEAQAAVDADRAQRRWRAQTTAATASYAIGLAGLVTGGVLWLLHRDSSARAATVNIADLSLELAPRFSPHGAMLRGTF
jgi:hypothetical protein